AQHCRADAHERAQALGAALVVIYGCVCSGDAVHNVAPRTFLFVPPRPTVRAWTNEGIGKCELKKPKPRCTMRPWTSKLQMRSLSERPIWPTTPSARTRATTTLSGRSSAL